MACDRIERVLQVVFRAQKATGLAEDLAYDCKRIPPYCQNADGEVKGIYFPSLLLTFDLTLSGRPMTGERCLVCILFSVSWFAFISRTGTMTEHRTKILSSLLPIALATGYTEVELGFEPLKVPLLSNPNHSVADLFAYRTLTPASTSKAMIHRHISLSLKENRM